MHVILKALAALAVAFTLVLPTAHAQDAASEESSPPPRLRQRDYSETALFSREGLEYRILMSVPRGPAPEGG